MPKLRKVIITQETTPFPYKDKKGYFHQWGIAWEDCGDHGPAQSTTAIIELEETGQIIEVPPAWVRFLDTDIYHITPAYLDKLVIRSTQHERSSIGFSSHKHVYISEMQTNHSCATCGMEKDPNDGLKCLAWNRCGIASCFWIPIKGNNGGNSNEKE